MTKDLLSHKSSDITSEACAWIAQLETGELTAADLEAFREWMQRSPRHAAEIKQLAQMSGDLNVLTDMAESLHEAGEEYRSVVGRRRQPTLTLARIAAVVAVVAVIFSVVLFQMSGPVEPRMLTTAVGEYREIELQDGTQVKLNTDSQIEVVYDKDQRKVRLLAGEAFFDVVPNPDRPFIVYANGKYVRVVGTAFLVSLIDRDFGLTVTEGRVELAETAVLEDAGKETVEPDNASSAVPTVIAPMVLEAGQSVSISGAAEVTPVTTLSERELQRELSWQEGLHDFSNTPLEEVVRELSRHSPIAIEIADPQLRDLKFGGIFRIGETKPLFDALEASFGIEVTYLDKNRVSLSLAEQG